MGSGTGKLCGMVIEKVLNIVHEHWMRLWYKPGLIGSEGFKSHLFISLQLDSGIATSD